MRKLWSDEAWDNYLYWEGQDKKIFRKINNLLKSIDRNGYFCEGHLEILTGDLSGYYSVHIDKKNRIVFRIIDNEILEILQCGTHYKDK